MDKRPPEKNPLFWFYGIGALVNGIKNHAFSYLLLIFATHYVGLAGNLAGLAIGIALIWDAFTDLILGHWSDETRSRIGRRHPFMYAALIILPISFWALFHPFDFTTQTGKFLYLLVCALLIRTGTTLFEVPATALLPEFEAQYERRNRWFSLRYFFGWFGGNGIHTLNFFFWVGAYGLTAHTGYSIYATVGAIIIAATILFFCIGTQKASAALPQPTSVIQFSKILDTLKHIFDSLKNRNILCLFLYGILVGIAGGVSAALYVYNVTYFFGFTGTQIAISGCFVFLGPALAYLFIRKVSPLIGKKPTAIATILVNCVLYPLPYILYLLGFWPERGSFQSLMVYNVILVIEVMMIVSYSSMLDSMTADVVEDSEVTTARRSEGLFFAARGLSAKFFSAGGLLFAGVIVTYIGMEGFVTDADMTDAHRLSLATVFLPLYVGLHLLSIGCLLFYRIDADIHAKNLNTLSSRREQMQADTPESASPLNLARDGS